MKNRPFRKMHQSALHLSLSVSHEILQPGAVENLSYMIIKPQKYQ